MPKMKLPLSAGEDGGDDTAEDESSVPRGFRAAAAAASAPSLSDAPEESGRGTRLDKETVFEWFGLRLEPAKRVEFMCGLLHMCQPLELRFLGSYLEDLARKDYHVLRDFEFRANSPGDLGALRDAVDPVTRSKLLVCLSLLGSDSRECAGILFGILNHVDPAALFPKNRDSSTVPLEEPRHRPFGHGGHAHGCPAETGGPSAAAVDEGPLEQLALLFTMASLHPAFHFHQRETVRARLDKIEQTLAERRQQQPRASAQQSEPSGQKEDFLPSAALGLGEYTGSHPPCQGRRSSRRVTQREAVHIEGIVLRSISRTRIDKEYNFEVKWSDMSSTTVTKTHLELENFLLKLPEDHCTESFEKCILRLLNQGDPYDGREVEKNIREMFLSAPPVFRHTRKVCSFFHCDSNYSAKRNSCRCNCQLGKAYQGDCSDASSQEEDSYDQGHKKKHGTKSQSQGLSSAKASTVDSWRVTHTAEVNGPAERRKKSCVLRNSHELGKHQDTEKKGHAVPKNKNRILHSDRDKGKGAAFVTNGSLVPAISLQRKDTIGETSSESYSSPSSPQHRGPGSLDSEDDNYKDTDSHSDDSGKGPTSDFFAQDSDPAVAGEDSSCQQVETLCLETNEELPALSFMQSLPYIMTNGADSTLPLVPPPSQNFLPSPGTLVMQMPPVPAAVLASGIGGDLQKKVNPSTFGIPTIGLHPAEPQVQCLKTIPSHGQVEQGASGGSNRAIPLASHQAMTPGAMSFSNPLLPSLPCPDSASLTSAVASSLPHGEASHAKHQGLPSGLPSVYSQLPLHTSVTPTIGLPASGIALTPGYIQQAAVPPAVPTHTPGPAPSPSPALTHSTAHSDSGSSGGIATIAPGNPNTFQQTQQQQVSPQQPTPPPQLQQQQQLMGCGMCGCHNNCGRRGSGGSNNSGGGVSGPTSCQAPLFFPAHQMAAARQVFSVPPPLFQLTNLCSNSYLTQAQPPHQANGAATIAPFFTSAPQPAHPSAYGSLHTHTHPHSHTDVPSHMLGNQAAAVAVAAAANYNLQQQMAPVASYCQRVYQHMYANPLAMMPAATLGGGGVNKKSGNVSCYNCGVSGHYAQDCNQPSIESTQQGKAANGEKHRNH